MCTFGVLGLSCESPAARTSTTLPFCWTCRDSSGDQIGPNYVTARDHQSAAFGAVLGFFHLRLSFRKLSMLAGQNAARHAHLRPHSGHDSGCALSHAPTTPDFTMPHLIQVLRERLRLPLFLTESTCSGCHEPLDPLEHHRAACSHSGHIQRRAIPIERVMPRICREASARVKFKSLLRDMNVRVASCDARRIEVLAQDLPCFGGSQLAAEAL